MEQTIRFETKEESNERRIQEALARTGHERLLFFFPALRRAAVFCKRRTTPELAER